MTMMYVLDTDHISLIHRGGVDGQRIMMTLQGIPPQLVAVTIISYEEQLRGWMATLAQARDIKQQKRQYGKLARMLRYYCSATILPFDDASVVVFQRLLLQRPRIGTMDLKIAAITLAHNHTLVTRNSSDFSKIP